ncbi:hypothetical protein [Patulibacter sp.]|uniref:hypothetical protein n=1 Tax=Patulibacter sp. TaxID=1912859 RepID=UPI0027220B63|nr:hypothetical protein [Patulibacter sp.]MDO9409240.1 hypothetical protein [Patulibacter sp.]
MQTSAAQLLAERLGLTDDEVLAVLDADPLSVIAGGEMEHKPQLALLLTLTSEPAEQVGLPTLHRWMRTAGPAGRPVELLTSRDFGAFEDALATLQERGLVIRKAR